MAIKLHHLRPAPGAKTAKTRVGRGEGSKGKTAGRGTKGTKARYQVSAGFEGGQIPLHMRLPKLKGFTNPFRVEYQVVNVGRIAELFAEGGTVDVPSLVEKGAVVCLALQPQRATLGRTVHGPCNGDRARHVARVEDEPRPPHVAERPAAVEGEARARLCGAEPDRRERRRIVLRRDDFEISRAACLSRANDQPGCLRRDRIGRSP